MELMSQSLDNSVCFRDEGFTPGDVTASGLPVRETLGEDQPVDDEVDTCRHWLDQRRGSKYVKEAAHSYRLKHAVEAWADTYVSNGALIKAALIEGIAVRRVGSGVNAHLGLRDCENDPVFRA